MLEVLAWEQCECTGLGTLFVEKLGPDFGNSPYYGEIGIKTALCWGEVRCSHLRQSGSVHGGIGVRGVRSAVGPDHWGAITFTGVADKLVVAHLVAIAAFDVFVRVGFLGARHGFSGCTIGRGAISEGLAGTTQFIEFGLDSSDATFVVSFDIFEGGKEVGFGFIRG